MKIAMLLEREPFGAILEKTLTRHLGAVTGRPHQVQWREGRPSARELWQGSRALWLCNPTLNAIFSVRARLRTFETPWREYLHGPTHLQTAMHGAYLIGASTPLGQAWLSRFHVRIQPELTDAASTLILGGNTRLRLIDHRRQLVTTILKDGFDASFIRRELELRQRRQDLLAPPVLQVLDHGRAFVEPLLHATVADRLFSRAEAQAAMVKALNACEQLGEGTAQSRNWQEWWPELRAKCRHAASKIRDDSARTVAIAVDQLEQLARAIARLKIMRVDLCESHGDLQAGNVMVDGARCWLIDWERTDLRTRGYDALTLALNARRRQAGLLARAFALLETKPTDPVADRAHDHLDTEVNRDTARQRMQLFLMEELRFHLEESAAGPMHGPTDSLKALVAEMGSHRGHPLLGQQ